MGGMMGLICLSLCFILVYDVVTQCDFFRSKEIRIIGAKRLSEQEVLRQAGISPPVNILAVNLNLVRKRLLRHPWIADAQVARELPDILTIRIREQKPLAILDLGGKFLINTRGEVFKAWTPSDPEDLPLVTGLTFSDIRLPHDSGSPAFDALMTTLNLGREEGAVLPNRQISRIQVDPDLGLTLYVLGGRKVVKLGYQDLKEKFKLLGTLLCRFDRQPGWTGFTTIDLVNPKRVIVNPARQDTVAGEIKEGFGAGT
jgi:cell division protein FtsQ